MEHQRELVDRALRAWRFFAEEEGLFNSWLAEKETIMDRMVSTKLTSSGQSGSSSSSGSQSPFAQMVIRQVRMLKSIELEMDSQVRRFDTLNDHAQIVVSSLGGNSAVMATISGQLEAMQHRWEALVLAMETHSQTLAATGVDLSEALLPSPSDSQEMQRSGGGSGSGGSSTGQQGGSATNVTSGKANSVSPASSCLSEFEFAARQLIEWLERAETGVGLMAVGDTRHPMSTEEQLSLLSEMKSELASQISQLEGVKTLGNRLVTDLEQAGESGVDVVEAIRSLETRLERLSQAADSSERRLLVSIDLRVLQEEMSSLNEVYAGYEKFLKSLGTEESVKHTDPGMTSGLIDQCRVKLKLMVSYGERIESLQQRSQQLQAPEDSMLEEISSLHREVSNFVINWKEVRRQIEDRLKALKTLAAQRPPKSVVESINALSRWLTEVEGVLNSERIEANEIFVLEEQLGQLSELGGAVREYEDYLTKVENGVKANAANAGTGSQEQANLQQSVTTLVEQYGHVRGTIEQHTKSLKQLLQTIQELQSNCDGLNTWFDEMKSYITETKPAVGDPSTLKQQTQEWRDAERDVSTLQETLRVIQELTNHLLSSASSSAFADKLVKQLATLQSRFSDTNNETKALGENLINSLEIVEKLWNDAELLAQFLESNCSKLSEEKLIFENEDQLKAKLEEIKELQNEFSGKSSHYASLQQTYDQLVPSGASTLDTPLNKILQRVNAAWDRLGCLIADHLASLQRFTIEVQQVRDLARQENEWLGDVEKRLQQCRRPLTDAEDISEQSYELENIWQKDLAAKCGTELRTLCDRLKEAQVCCELLSEIRVKIDEKKESVGKEVSNDLARLESLLQQSQELERTLLGAMQWLSDADELLQSRLENDILAGDVPQEFEALQNEFADHEKTMDNLEQIKKDLTSEGRELAAARLDQQMDLIKERFVTVHHKFAKFQRPADFETKLERVRHTLDDVEEKLHLLEIREGDLETLSSQLDHCLKFYRTLSEAKPEVEYVLRTGRQVVEKCQVDYPEKLSAQLDHVKHRFNSQGAQVTQSKGMLERAAKLAKKLTKDSNVLRDLLTKVDAAVADVRQNDENGIPIMSVDDGIRLLEVLQGQLGRRQQTLKSAEDCMSQLGELAFNCCNGGETAQNAMIEWLSERHSTLPSKIQKATSDIAEALVERKEVQTRMHSIQHEIQTVMELIGSSLFRAEAQLRRWTGSRESSTPTPDIQKLQVMKFFFNFPLIVLILLRVGDPWGIFIVCNDVVKLSVKIVV